MASMPRLTTEQAEYVADRMNDVQWGAMDDGKLYFKGKVGGLPRQIVGESAGQLADMLQRMALGDA